MNTQAYWLNNVRLETGFRTAFDETCGCDRTETETGLFDILIRDGLFAVIQPAGAPNDGRTESGATPRDGGGLLLLPAYRDMHTHIDKTYVGEGYRACSTDRVLTQIIESEAKLYPTFRTTVEDRAKRLIENFIKLGTTTIRTHVDVVRDAKLTHLEETKRALDSFGDQIQYEIVAFPQHGLLRSDSRDRLEYALQNGGTLLGGVDPDTLDGDRDRSLALTMELAVKYDVGIDYHLHEGGEGGYRSYRQLMELAKKAGLENRLTISHALFLCDLEEKTAERVAEELAENDVLLTTAVPLGGRCPNFPFYAARGVRVAIGVDGVHDSWSPYGTGSVLEKLQHLGMLFGIRKEKELAAALGYITGGITPLDGEGNRVWPVAGDRANFQLAEASCTAQVVARRIPARSVANNGSFIDGQQ